MFFSTVKVNSWSNSQNPAQPSTQGRALAACRPAHFSRPPSSEPHAPHGRRHACFSASQALSAAQSHAAAAQSSHTGHWQPPWECWETHFINCKWRNTKGGEAVQHSLVRASTARMQNLPVMEGTSIGNN